MLAESFLYSVINGNDTETLFKVKDKFLPVKEQKYLEFVKDFYASYNKLPDLTTVENKFRIQLIDNTETTGYWYNEIISKYQEYVIEQAVVNSAKNKKKALDFFQQAIVDYNVDIDSKIADYSDKIRRATDYNNRKGTKGITYLSTGDNDLDTFSLGYKRADLWTIGGAEGMGKAEPISNLIHTYNKGLISFGSLEVGDLVYGSDGKSQKVLAIYPQGVRPVYKISFADGTDALCDEEHLWSSQTSNDRKTKKFVVRTTKELKAILKKGSYIRIPNTPTIYFDNKKNLDIHPYVLGCILGDGCMVNNDTTFTNSDNSIMDRVKKLWDNYSIVKGTRDTDAPTIRLKGIDKYLKILGLKGKNSYTKFIPDDFLNSSVYNRIELLRGLMDTDGYIPKNSANAEFSVRSFELSQGITYLVRSLGGIAIQNTKQVLGKTVFIVRISFYADNFINVFNVSRKSENFKPKSKNSNGGKIIRSIEYSHDEECQCISVENEDKLYLTGLYGIVTHNTWYLLRMALWLDQYMLSKNIKKNILIVSGEMESSELEERMDAIICELSYARLSKGELTPAEERKYKRWLNGNYESNIRIVDSFDNLKDIEYFITVYRPGATFIDGSHLLASSYDWTEIARVTAGMKKLTRNKKVPIINTTHLKAEKGKSAKGGSTDDFAYTKGYTRDSDIVGVMYASDMMQLENKVGMDWVKVRRANRTQIVYENDYETCKTKVISNLTGQQLSGSISSSGGSKRASRNGQLSDDDIY